MSFKKLLVFSLSLQKRKSETRGEKVVIKKVFDVHEHIQFSQGPELLVKWLGNEKNWALKLMMEELMIFFVYKVTDNTG